VGTLRATLIGGPNRSTKQESASTLDAVGLAALCQHIKGCDNQDIRS
jgi:hypothetical protein